MAPAAGLARRRRRRSTRLPPSLRRRRRLGVAGAARQRALPRCPPRDRPRMARRRRPRSHRAGSGVPRGVDGRAPRPSARPWPNGAATRPVRTAGSAACSTATAVFLAVSLLAGVVAVERGTGDRQATRHRRARGAREQVGRAASHRPRHRRPARGRGLPARARRPARALGAAQYVHRRTWRSSGTTTSQPTGSSWGAVVPGTSTAVVALDGDDLQLVDLETGELEDRFPSTGITLSDSPVRNPSQLQVSADGRFVVHMTTTESSEPCFDPQAPPAADDRPCVEFSMYELASGRRVLGPVIPSFGAGTWPSTPTARSSPSPVDIRESSPSIARPTASCSVPSPASPVPTRCPPMTPLPAAPRPRSPSALTASSTSARSRGRSGSSTPPLSRSSGRSRPRRCLRTSTSCSPPMACSSGTVASPSSRSRPRPAPPAGPPPTTSSRFSGHARAPRSPSRLRPRGSTARTLSATSSSTTWRPVGPRASPSSRRLGLIADIATVADGRELVALGQLPVISRWRLDGSGAVVDHDRRGPGCPRLRPDRRDAARRLRRPRCGIPASDEAIDELDGSSGARWFGRDLLAGSFPDGSWLYDVGAHAPAHGDRHRPADSSMPVWMIARRPTGPTSRSRRTILRPALAARSGPTTPHAAAASTRPSWSTSSMTTTVGVDARVSATGDGSRVVVTTGTSDYAARRTIVYDGRTGEQLAGPMSAGHRHERQRRRRARRRGRVRRDHPVRPRRPWNRSGSSPGRRVSCRNSSSAPTARSWSHHR